VRRRPPHPAADSQLHGATSAAVFPRLLLLLPPCVSPNLRPAGSGSGSASELPPRSSPGAGEREIWGADATEGGGKGGTKQSRARHGRANLDASSDDDAGRVGTGTGRRKERGKKGSAGWEGVFIANRAGASPAPEPCGTTASYSGPRWVGAPRVGDGGCLAAAFLAGFGGSSQAASGCSS
jgi:hypothetical protein